MANPTTGWDPIPVWGAWRNPITDLPLAGQVAFTVMQRVTRVDGRVIYAEGAQRVVTIGDMAQQDTTIRNAVRVAWKTADSVLPGYVSATWDAWWDTIVVPSAVFVGFPASDDPDIVQVGYSVTVSERLESVDAQYSITPLLAHLDLPVPGINLGLIEVPPGSPTPSDPMYAKGIAGGVASLGSDGKIPSDQLPPTGVDAETVRDILGSTLGGTLPIVVTPNDGADTVTVSVNTGTTGTTVAVGNDARFTDQRTPLDNSVTNAKVPTGAAISADKIVDGTTNKVYSAADKAKVAGLAAVATSGSAADLTGTLPTAVLPPLAINDVTVAANQAAMLALTAQRGDMAIRSDNGKTYVLASDSPTTLADWKEILAAGQVQSVAGKTGVVTLDGADIATGSIAGARLPTATETQVGVLEVATSGEATTGTLDNVMVTPLKLKAVTDAAGLTAGTIPLARAAAGLCAFSTSAAARGTARTDLIVIFITASDPTSVMLSNDVWLRP